VPRLSLLLINYGLNKKNRHGGPMQNVVINMCEKFDYDWLRNDRYLGNRKSDKNKKNKKKNNVRSHWGPV